MIVNTAIRLIDWLIDWCIYLQPENDPEQLEPWLVKEMDSCISDIFLNEDQDAFIQLFNLILYENVNGITLTFALIFITREYDIQLN